MKNENWYEKREAEIRKQILDSLQPYGPNMFDERPMERKKPIPINKGLWIQISDRVRRAPVEHGWKSWKVEDEFGPAGTNRPAKKQHWVWTVFYVVTMTAWIYVILKYFIYG